MLTGWTEHSCPNDKILDSEQLIAAEILWNEGDLAE